MTYPEMFPIELTVCTMLPSVNTYNYIWYIFVVLSEHKKVLKNPDYKRLYDEAIDCLFFHLVLCGSCDIDNRKYAYGILRLLADLDILKKKQKKQKKFPIRDVDHLLEERRKIWMM